MAKPSTKSSTPQVKRRAAPLELDALPKGKGQDTVKVSDVMEVLNLADASGGQFVPLRIVDGFVPLSTHWLATEGKEDKTYAFPKPCLSFDPETGRRDADVRCPYCEAEEWFSGREVKVKVGKGEKNPAQCQTEYYTNVISRTLQDQIDARISTEEERESGLAVKGSKSRTPIRAMRITGGVVAKIRDVQETNMQRVKEKGKDKPVRKSMPVNHVRYGCDIFIKFDQSAKSPGDMYAVQRGDLSPLTDEEKEYLKWDTPSIPFLNPIDSEAEAEKEIGRLKGKWWDKYRKFAKIEDESSDYDDDEDDEDDEDEDEEDERPSRGKKGKAPAKGKKSRRDEEDDEDDYDMDEEDDEDDEDEDDEPPRKKGKGKAPAKSTKKKSSRHDDDEDDEDDEDEDDDDLDDDEDEDDEPPRKKGKASTSKSKSKKSSRDEDDEDEDEDDEDEDDDLDDDEDDEDDDFDDEDDEDDEPPAKSAKGGNKKASSKASGKNSSKKSRRDEDEDDEDDEDDLDDDEDEDDEPPRKKGKASTKPASKTKKRSRDEDEDDEDDEDEDDEPPRKKSTSKGKASSKSKKRSRNDEDDDLPF